jgi:hypothetical protein
MVVAFRGKQCDAIGASTAKGFTRQLELRLDSSRDVLLLATKNITARDFAHCMRENRPNIVVDLRYFPTFDFGGMPKNFAFQEMIKYSGRYDRTPLPFHEIQVPTSWHYIGKYADNVVNQLSSMRKRLKGPIIVIVENEADGRRTSNAICELLWRKTGYQWFFRSLTTFVEK